MEHDIIVENVEIISGDACKDGITKKGVVVIIVG